MKDNFEKSLESLDLQGLILVIGLLAQRALVVMSEDKKPKSKLLKPSK